MTVNHAAAASTTSAPWDALEDPLDSVEDPNASVGDPNKKANTTLEDLFAGDLEDFEPGKPIAPRLNLSAMFDGPDEWQQLRPIAIERGGWQLVTRVVMEGNNRVVEAQVSTPNSRYQGGTRWVRSDDEIAPDESKVYRVPNSTRFYDIDSSIIMELKYEESIRKIDGKTYVDCVGHVWNLGAHGRGTPTKIGQVGPVYTNETVSPLGAQLYGARVGKPMLRRDVYASFPTFCRNWILEDNAVFAHSKRCFELVAMFPEVDARIEREKQAAHAALVAKVQAELTTIEASLKETLAELRAIRDKGQAAEGEERAKLARAFAAGQDFKTFLQDRRVEVAVKIRNLNDEPVEVIYPRVAA